MSWRNSMSNVVVSCVACVANACFSCRCSLACHSRPQIRETKVPITRIAVASSTAGRLMRPAAFLHAREAARCPGLPGSPDMHVASEAEAQASIRRLTYIAAPGTRPLSRVPALRRYAACSRELSGGRPGSEDCASYMETQRRRLSDPEVQPAWEPLFWDVFERSLNPISLLDESRRVLEVNSAAVELLGYRPEDLVGKSLEELITNPPRARRDKEWRRLLQTGEQSGAYTFRRRDRSQIEIDFACRLVGLGQRSLVVAVVLPLGRVTLARRVGDRDAPLTVREREVVALIARGLDTKQIAKDLYISPGTVRKLVGNAMAKLGVHTRAELVAVAFSRGELLQAGRGEV